jgi:putative FmdB family regulatory protein
VTAAVPLYEYECSRCGRFERIQKFADPPVTACPTCGGGVQKLLSPPAIQFKGSGWYVTDYAGKGTRDDGAAKKAAKDAPSKEGAKEGSAAKESSAPATSKDSAGSGSPSTK